MQAIGGQAVDNQTPMIGRVLQASTTRFAIGCQQPISAQAQDLPAFGAFVRAPGPADTTSFGVVYNVIVEDDLLVRQLVAAGVEDEVYIADQRQRRQVPVVVEILLVGFSSGSDIFHYLPSRPPASLDRVYACNSAEIVRFTARYDWLRTVLTAADVPTDHLVAAALRAAAAARPPDQREAYLVGAGRELAKLLAMDPARLDTVLKQIHSQ